MNTLRTFEAWAEGLEAFTNKLGHIAILLVAVLSIARFVIYEIRQFVEFMKAILL